MNYPKSKTNRLAIILLAIIPLLAACGNSQSAASHIRAPKAFYPGDLKEWGNPDTKDVDTDLIDANHYGFMMSMYLHTVSFSDLGDLTGPNGSINSGIYTTETGAKITLDVFATREEKQTFINTYHTKNWGEFSKAHGGHVFGFGNWLMWTSDAKTAKAISVVLGEDEL